MRVQKDVRPVTVLHFLTGATTRQVLIHINLKASFKMRLRGKDRHVTANLNDVLQNETKL